MIKNKASLVIGGDFYVSPKYKFKESVSSELREFLSEADLSIINLEAPITKESDSISKSGPALKMDSGTAANLFLNGVNACTLANNHIFDYGERAVKDTLSWLDKQNVSYMGLNNSKIKSFNINQLNIAIVNMAENEWSTDKAYDNHASGFNNVELYRLVTQAKSEHDFVFVILHAGVENHELPPPFLIDSCRFAIDLGADGIFCHHSHMIGRFESYNGKPIYYGLGNFIFPDSNKDTSWHQGLIVKIQIEDKNLVNIESFSTVTVVSEDTFSIDIKEPMHPKLLQYDSEYEKTWSASLLTESKTQVLRILGLNIYISKLRRLLKVGYSQREKLHLKLLLNTMRCESLRSRMIEMLKVELDK